MIHAAFLMALTTYHTIKAGGVNIFYREAGPKHAPAILLLHGFPSSSRMFDSLIPLLADRYHVVAPDYPGFGHSDAPPPDRFAYTFQHIAQITEDFTNAMGLSRYSLYMQDYGGPVGFRLAVAHPERVQALIVQNAVAHEEGLAPLWAARRAYWADPAAHEAQIRANILSFEAARPRHVGTSPNPERYNPDTWTDEYAFLTRPGEVDIQLALSYDYRTNVEQYPVWQAYLRKYQPPTLVVWGKYDAIFTVAGATAYKRDVPRAEVHVLDAGHFALDDASAQIAALIRSFLERHALY